MDSTNNLVLNRLFTKQVINDLVKNNNNELYSSAIKRYIKNFDNISNKQIISSIYNYMSKNYRNEYFYQNTLLNKLLLGRHSINTTTALSQVPIERSKADFILINGKAVVYEIKTELDTFERLKTQLDDYYKAFNYVCVVTCENNFNKLYEQLKDTKIGIYVLSKKNTIQFKKNPEEYNTQLNHSTFFKILRKNEYEHILLEYFGVLPEATPAFHYNECLKVFKTIPLMDAYKLFLCELKKRNAVVHKDEFAKVPYELKSVIYFSDLKDSYYQKLTAFLNNLYKEEIKCTIHM